MKGFTKDNYLTVQFIYADYSDFMEKFSTDWTPKEAINWMKEQSYHKMKDERLTEIIVSKVTKYEVGE